MLRKRVDQRPIEVTEMLARALRQATKSPENQYEMRHYSESFFLYHICVNLIRRFRTVPIQNTNHTKLMHNLSN